MSGRLSYVPGHIWRGATGRLKEYGHWRDVHICITQRIKCNLRNSASVVLHVPNNWTTLLDQIKRLWQQCFGAYRVILVDSLQHRFTINNETYVTALKKRNEAIKKKKVLKMIHSIKLHPHNAHPHTSFIITQKSIAKAAGQ